MTAKFNLETEYQAKGQQVDTVSLNVAHNKNQTVSTSYIYPTLEGKIEITVKKGPNNTHPMGHYFLGAAVISIFDNED